MHRQALIVATAGLAALVLTGCSTLDDATVAGRVEEATISSDDVVEVLADTPDGFPLKPQPVGLNSVS